MPQTKKLVQGQPDIYRKNEYNNFLDKLIDSDDNILFPINLKNNNNHHYLEKSTFQIVIL